MALRRLEICSNYSGRKLTKTQIVIVVFVTAICLFGAVMVKTEYCPDEPSRQLLTEYIYTNMKLPIGDEPEIQIGNYGYSYALRPYLSSMIGAVFMRLGSIFSTDASFMITMSRMLSVISIALIAVFSFKIGNLIFQRQEAATLFGVIISCLPQVIFLGMYQNNDVFSLMCVLSACYYLIRGHRQNWNMADCVKLGFSASVCLLSYYSVYGWILTGGLFFICGCAMSVQLTAQEKATRLSNVFGIVLLLAGWFFIRNAVIHEGDFFGVATEEVYRNRLTERGVEVFKYFRPSEEMTFLEFLKYNNWAWFVTTVRSFVGKFGTMKIQMFRWQYGAYYAILLGGGILCTATAIKHGIRKHEKQALLLLGISSAITFVISLLHSYFRDYQPQGRYVITCIIMLSYFISKGFDMLWIGAEENGADGSALRMRCVSGICWVITAVFIGLLVYAFLRQMAIMFTLGSEKIWINNY